MTPDGRARPLRLPRLVSCILAALALTGCLQDGTYRLAVSNAGDVPATIHVSVTSARAMTEAAAHTFDSVPPNETLSVPAPLKTGRTYVAEGRTLDDARRVTTEFRAQGGTWWITVFVEPDGRLTSEVLREP